MSEHGGYLLFVLHDMAVFITCTPYFINTACAIVKPFDYISQPSCYWCSQLPLHIWLTPNHRCEHSVQSLQNERAHGLFSRPSQVYRNPRITDFLTIDVHIIRLH